MSPLAAVEIGTERVSGEASVVTPTLELEGGQGHPFFREAEVEKGVSRGGLRGGRRRGKNRPVGLP